jgi:hypothetical protein
MELAWVRGSEGYCQVNAHVLLQKPGGALLSRMGENEQGILGGQLCLWNSAVRAVGVRSELLCKKFPTCMH